MQIKKCLLVRLPYWHHVHTVPTLPVGIGYVAEALHAAGVEYDVFDMAFHDSGVEGFEVSDLIRKIREYRPDVVGFSMMTLRHRQHYAMIRTIKYAFPALTLVAGGPHLSTMRDVVLRDCDSIDFGFVLEADRSFVEFCRGTNIQDIKGILYRSEGQVVYTGDPDPILDLDSLNFPRYRKFMIEKYPEKNTIYLLTSRGCPHQCTYCPVRLSIGRKLRVVSPVRLVEEIVYWHRQGVRKFVIWDDNFTYIKKRVLEFCDLIEKAQLSGYVFAIPNGIRADRVDREMLQRMKRLGFSQVSIGVESASNKVLANLKKGETVEQIEQAIKDATDLGYQVYLYYILGSPGETVQDVEKSFALALKYPVADARFYKLIPFPGTELFDWVSANNLFLRTPDEYLNDADHFDEEPCFRTPELDRDERIRLYRKGVQVSRQIRMRGQRKRFEKAGIFAGVLAGMATSELCMGMYKSIMKSPVAHITRGVRSRLFPV